MCSKFQMTLYLQGMTMIGETITTHYEEYYKYEERGI